ncbi:MAG: TonB family protein [Notoacmeibacter sp.]|nr:TonB family protein [Notoacmeibacter sp.]
MNRRALLLPLALAASVCLHMAGAAAFLGKNEDMQIEGAAPTALTIIGNAFEDAAKAGEESAVEEVVPSADVQPVEEVAEAKATPDETEPMAAMEEPVAEAAEPDVREVMPVAAQAAIAALPDEQSAVAVPDTPEETETASEEPAPRPVAEARAPKPEKKKPQARPEHQRKPAAKPEPRTKAADKPKPKPVQKTAKAQTRKATAARNSKASKEGSRGKADRDAIKAAGDQSKAAKNSRAAGNADVSNYPGKIASRIRRSLKYPAEARAKRLRGQTVVSFVVSRSGAVSGVSVARSSGSPVLDNAAVAAVRRASPFPPIPDGAGRASWPFTVPLAFSR